MNRFWEIRSPIRLAILSPILSRFVHLAPRPSVSPPVRRCAHQISGPSRGQFPGQLTRHFALSTLTMRRSTRQAAKRNLEPESPGTSGLSAVERSGKRRKTPTMTPEIDPGSAEEASNTRTKTGSAEKEPSTQVAPRKDILDQDSADDFVDVPVRNPEVAHRDERWYWLLKAEPEPRYERGLDVSFPIDKLMARKHPEPWDGIRNYVARNNLRSMNAGDLAFFYHSNCKNPGIVGVMEIVREYSEDTSAYDPAAPYYDASCSADKNKWSVVHVAFRKRFAVPIYLRELRELGREGAAPLQSMQLLKQSRLSVSRVSADEFDFLVALADRKAQEQGLEHTEANLVH